ncbi:MAG: hypothetical protein QF719_10725 [Chloroflexota bacterium]|nr:hypothetical protein [Chloroflexota bacterium]MDP6508743.1 hypothetical protein [Chloroflexota bacterium]MDP6758653.1 hypothetical protein [Chloroflexota bacterium]
MIVAFKIDECEIEAVIGGDEFGRNGLLAGPDEGDVILRSGHPDIGHQGEAVGADEKPGDAVEAHLAGDFFLDFHID